jgi:hypothetical protein
VSNSPYQDDPVSIPDDARLLRRISQLHVDWTLTDDEGQPRVVGQGVQFYDKKRAAKAGCPGPAMSFYLKNKQPDLDAFLDGMTATGDGIAEVLARDLRALGDGKSIGIQPWERPDYPGHVVVFRLDGARDLSNGMKDSLREHLREGFVRLPSPPP